MKRSAFISAFLLSAASLASAAVGDSVDTSLYVADGVIMSTQSNGSLVINRADSTRFYDSTKYSFWVQDENDSNLCWAHAASNSIQYWQSYYGVFAKPQQGIYYDANGVQMGSEYPYQTYEMPLPYGKIAEAGTAATDERQLAVARNFYYNISKNKGGTFKAAAEWFFRGQTELTNSEGSFYFKKLYTGGYYKNYFEPLPAKTSDYSEPEKINGLSYTTIYSKFIEERPDLEDFNHEVNNSTIGSAFAFGNTDIKAVTNYILEGFGISDGKQTQAGRIPIIGLWKEDKGTGHFVTCYGFTTKANGELESILIANSDDGITANSSAYIHQRYVSISNDKIVLYADKDLSERWGTYYIGEVSYINTPEVLQNMLAEYSDTAHEAQVWNGISNVWEQQTATTEALPTEATGWDINVNGDNIATKHQGYYHTYATNGRAVLFDDHAEVGNRTITISGEVAASLITVAAKGYVFQEAESGGSIAAEADLALVNGASLDSSVALNVNNLKLEGGTTIKSDAAIVVTGDFLAALAPQAATFAAVRSTVTPQASVNAPLDLRQADSVTLETSVNMNGNDLYIADLYIADAFKLVLNMVEDEVIPCFTNIGDLYIGDTKQDSFQIATQVYFGGDANNPVDYFLVYDSALSTFALMQSIPEPTTATLSLLALAAMAARRRR